MGWKQWQQRCWEVQWVWTTYVHRDITTFPLTTGRRNHSTPHPILWYLSYYWQIVVLVLLLVVRLTVVSILPLLRFNKLCPTTMTKMTRTERTTSTTGVTESLYLYCIVLYFIPRGHQILYHHVKSFFCFQLHPQFTWNDNGEQTASKSVSSKKI